MWWPSQQRQVKSLPFERSDQSLLPDFNIIFPITSRTWLLCHPLLLSRVEWEVQKGAYYNCQKSHLVVTRCVKVQFTETSKTRCHVKTVIWWDCYQKLFWSANECPKLLSLLLRINAVVWIMWVTWKSFHDLFLFGGSSGPGSWTLWCASTDSSCFPQARAMIKVRSHDFYQSDVSEGTSRLRCASSWLSWLEICPPLSDVVSAVHPSLAGITKKMGGSSARRTTGPDSESCATAATIRSPPASSW